MSLVEIVPAEFAVDVRMVYGTSDNFTGTPIYRRRSCYLHPDAAAALRRAAELARPLGVRLVIYDAFRPTEAQHILWGYEPNPTYVAEPREGSAHSRGVAVDVSLIGADGHELDMGTGVDAFTPRSHHGNTEISPAAQRNRLQFLGLMTVAGWRHYPYEWWHYQLPDASRYPLLTDGDAGTRMMQ